MHMEELFRAKSSQPRQFKTAEYTNSENTIQPNENVKINID